MRKILFIIVLFVFSNIVVFAQVNDVSAALEKMKEFRKADNYLYKGRFKQAIDEYTKLTDKYRDDPDMNLKLGYCYLKTGIDNPKAILHLEKAIGIAVESNNGEQVIHLPSIEPYLFLAEAYHHDYKFDKAINLLESIENKARDDIELFSRLRKLKQYCINAKEIIKSPIPITVINMGKNINSPFSDHSPIVSTDEKTLIFTSTRQGVSENKQDNGEFYEDIFVSYLKDCQWTTPKIISNKINSNSHEAACSLSANGRYLFVFRNGNIFISEKKKNKWSELRKVRRPVNKSFTKESHAVMSPDDKFLIFTSERKGGFGGLDLYIAYRDKKGRYRNVENMGETLNTKYDEETPFITPDGKTLYFSSKGHNSIGGFDVFVSHLVDGQWTKPQNIGYPINTVGDDVFFMPSADGKRAYYSSKQSVGSGKTDLFIIWFNDKNELPLVSANITDGEKPVDAKITLTNLRTLDKENELIASESGEFSYLVTPCAEHNILIEAEDRYFKFENVGLSSGLDRKYDTTFVMQSVKDKSVVQVYKSRIDKKIQSCNNATKLLLNALSRFVKTHDNLLLDISFNKKSYNNAEIREYEESFRNILIENGVDENRINSQLYSNTVENGLVSFTVHDSTHTVISVTNIADEILAENNENNVPGVAGVHKNAQDRYVGLYHVRNVIFKKNKYKTNAYNESLDMLAAYLKANSNAKIELTGYTDTQGSTSYNYQLANKRASFVMEYLLKKGVPANQIKKKAAGESNQIARNQTKNGKLNSDALKYNRRVEINLISGGNDVLIVENVDVPEIYRTEKKDSELPDGKYFSIILQSSDTPLNLYHFIGLRNVTEKRTSNEGTYIYYYGKFYARSDAEYVLKELKKAGYEQASVFIPDY